jgi:hypothetical protein
MSEARSALECWNNKTENRENSNPRGFRYGMRKEFRKLAL